MKGARVRHPTHEWRGFRLDRSGLWPVLTIGWWTIEYVRQPAATRLIEFLTELRRK